MITCDQLTPIGHTIKPHGINGEIATAIDNDVDLSGLRCLVMDIDGIFVPFFINSFRPRGPEAVLLAIDGISNEREAKDICPKTVYALKTDIGELNKENTDNDDGFYAEDLIGFHVVVGGNGIGEITAVDDSTENYLFIITPNRPGKPLYIPVADEFIDEVDPLNHTIAMSLPNGLLDL